MTDERAGERQWVALESLPPGAGVVFRHYAMPPGERSALAHRIGTMCRRLGLILAVARDEELAIELDAALVHNPPVPPVKLPFSTSAHSVAEAKSAREAGAALVFVSPVYRTRSHPEATPLGEKLAVRIAEEAGVPAIALGGMDARKAEGLMREGFHGWAAIDAWIGQADVLP